MIKKIKNRKNEKGFTLVELLVSVSIFAIVIVIAASIFFVIVRINNQARLISKLKNNGARVIEDMERDLKATDWILIENGGQTLKFRKNNSDYYSYEIATSGNGNEIIMKGENCGSDYSNCVFVTVTPNDSENGIDVVEAESNFAYFSEQGEVRVTLVFGAVEALSSLKDYQATIELETTVKLRDY